ncbi:MAG: ABC transporter ATP-binding protein [Sciscionella sp.]
MSAAERSILFRCRDAARTYGRGTSAVVAVHLLSCVVRAGDLIAITGTSGSGKTTVLHLLAGLDRPTTGDLRWPGLGGDPAGSPGSVGVVFQGPSLLPALDVTENVALPLLLAGESAAAATARAREALEQLDLAGLAAKLPEELSGGQSQRVAVARVVASKPQLILADEPTGQLDAVHCDQVVRVLIDAAHRLGAALVVATHDPLVADRLRIRWRIRDGRLTTEDNGRGAQVPARRAEGSC